MKLNIFKSRKKRQADLRRRAERMQRAFWLVPAKAADYGVEIGPIPQILNDNLQEILTQPIENLREAEALRLLDMLEAAIPDVVRPALGLKGHQADIG